MLRKHKSRTYWIADGLSCSWICLLALLGTYQGLMQQHQFSLASCKGSKQTCEPEAPCEQSPGKAPKVPLLSSATQWWHINVIPAMTLMIMLRLKWDQENLKHPVLVNWKISTAFLWIILLHHFKKCWSSFSLALIVCIWKSEKIEMQVLGFSVKQLKDNIEVFDN